MCKVTRKMKLEDIVDQMCTQLNLNYKNEWIRDMLRKQILAKPKMYHLNEDNP